MFVEDMLLTSVFVQTQACCGTWQAGLGWV